MQVKRRGGVLLRGGQDQRREADRVQQDEALQGNLLRRVQGARLGAAGESGRRHVCHLSTSYSINLEKYFFRPSD